MGIAFSKTTKTFNRACIGMVVTKKCRGDCCGSLLMTGHEFSQVAHRARFGYRVEELGNGYNRYTIDEHDCPFLRKDSRRCKIYSKRPGICRQFGDESTDIMCCPHLTKGGKIRKEKKFADLKGIQLEIAARLRGDIGEEDDS